MFLSHVLPGHDSILYTDTDVIYMRTFRHVYAKFAQFKRSQWAAMGPDWYHIQSQLLPYYGSQGINSGVGLYNLTRMKASDFVGQIEPIYQEFKNNSEFLSDQVRPCLKNFKI